MSMFTASPAVADRGAPADTTCCPVVELRQYTLHPGRRDELIALFEREFVESQEATGMRLLGQFRDLDAPDRFVWLRGFADMEARARALAAFYDGPVWRAHRDAANATMIDSDNVLLLRPAASGTGFALDGQRAAIDEPPPAAGLLVATLYSFDAPVDLDFLDFFARELQPAFAAAGAQLVASFVTESAPNTFPRLPVREGEHVFAWFARFRDEAAHSAYRAALVAQPGWRELAVSLGRRLQGPPEVLRLAPTARSLLR
jgi:quinol monooxygenase YgiN